MLLLDRINELNNLGFKYFFVDNITSLGYFFEDFEEFIAQVNKLNFKLIISGNESSFFTDFLNKLYVIDSTKMSMKEFHYLFNDISEDCIINNFGRTVFNDEYDSDYEGIIKSYGYNFQNYVNSKDYKFVSPSIQLKAEENRLYFYVTKVVRYHAYRIIVDAINKEYYDPYKLQEIINNDINRIKVKAIHLDQNVTILDWLVYRHYLEHCEYINGLTLDHRFEKMPLNIFNEITEYLLEFGILKKYKTVYTLTQTYIKFYLVKALLKNLFLVKGFYDCFSLNFLTLNDHLKNNVRKIILDEL